MRIPPVVHTLHLVFNAPDAQERCRTVLADFATTEGADRVRVLAPLGVGDGLPEAAGWAQVRTGTEHAALRLDLVAARDNRGPLKLVDVLGRGAGLTAALVQTWKPGLDRRKQVHEGRFVVAGKLVRSTDLRKAAPSLDALLATLEQAAADDAVQLLQPAGPIGLSAMLAREEADRTKHLWFNPAELFNEALALVGPPQERTKPLASESAE
jgi:hypothetical protein